MFFASDNFNQDISSWDVSAVTNISGMFRSAKAFNQSLAAWVAKFNTDVNLANMLNSCGMDVTNYDATLTGFNAGTVMGRNLGASGLEYCAAKADRDNLVLPLASGGKGWTISGDAISAACNISSNAGPDQTQCNDENFTLAGNTPSIGTGSWSLTNGTATITTPTSATSTVTGIVAGSSATLKWTITIGSNVSEDEIILTNDAVATIANAGADQTILNSSDFTMAANQAIVGTGLWSIVSSTGTIAEPTNPNTRVTDVALNTKLTLKWTITNGACSSSDEVDLFAKSDSDNDGTPDEEDTCDDRIDTDVQLLREAPHYSNPAKPKYAHSKLQNEQKKHLLKKIIDIMEIEKIYRQPDLTINGLAIELAIPKHYISQIINEQLDSGFLDFNNSPTPPKPPPIAPQAKTASPKISQKESAYPYSPLASQAHPNA